MTPLIIPQGKGYIPNQFVYEVSPLKELLKEENGELWLKYLHYYYYPDFTDNPFYLLDEFRKKETILGSLGLKGVKEPSILKSCEEFVIKIYENPVIRLHNSLKISIDKMSDFLRNMTIDDKNIKNIESLIKNFSTILDNYQKTAKSVIESIKTGNQKVRGNQKIGYDL
jgi:hypothetical protein